MHSAPRDSLPEHPWSAGGSSPRPAAWPSLLVVDDDPTMRETLVCYFEHRGFHVAACGSVAEAKLQFHRAKAWKLVVCDFHLPDGTGAELSEWIRRQGRPLPTPILLMSGSPHAVTLCHGEEFLAKPFPLSALEARVRAATNG